MIRKKDQKYVQLAGELNKLLIQKLKRGKVHARFGYIWAVNLIEIGLLSSKNKNVKNLLCVTYLFTKYARVKPLNGNKSKTVPNPFIKIVNKSNYKPNKL